MKYFATCWLGDRILCVHETDAEMREGDQFEHEDQRYVVTAVEPGKPEEGETEVYYGCDVQRRERQ